MSPSLGVYIHTIKIIHIILVIISTTIVINDCCYYYNGFCHAKIQTPDSSGSSGPPSRVPEPVL